MIGKEYLGDGVYIEVEDGMFKITTEDGIEVTNTIFLEPEVYEALDRYAKKAFEENKYTVSESYDDVGIEGVKCSKGHLRFRVEVRSRGTLESVHTVLICMECKEERVAILDHSDEDGFRLLNEEEEV